MPRLDSAKQLRGFVGQYLEMKKDRFPAPRDDNHRGRIHLIESDIESGMTSLRIARTELDLGKVERATSLLAKAKQAHSTVAKIMADLEESEERQQLREKHRALDEGIRELERRKRRWEEQAS